MPKKPLAQFGLGEQCDLTKLPPDVACSILGKPLYEALLDTQQPLKGCLRVIAIDRYRGIVSVRWEPS